MSGPLSYRRRAALWLGFFFLISNLAAAEPVSDDTKRIEPPHRNRLLRGQRRGPAAAPKPTPSPVPPKKPSPRPPKPPPRPPAERRARRR